MRADLIELGRLRTSPFACSYVPGELETLEYRIITSLSAQAFERLLSCGWRRFGYEFFRPVCSSCMKCRGLRVLVNQFKPSQSQRRTLRRNQRLEVIVQRPSVTKRHIDLYNAYHTDMHVRRGWPLQTMSEELYCRTYIDSPGDFAREFLYWDDDRLVGVGLADVLPNCLSSVSFFHDPGYRADALGVFSVLCQQQFARERNLEYQYLGYWIRECGSMAYKAQYGPHEVLERFPADGEKPVWIRSDAL